MQYPLTGWQLYGSPLRLPHLKCFVVVVVVQLAPSMLPPYCENVRSLFRTAVN